MFSLRSFCSFVAALLKATDGVTADALCDLCSDISQRLHSTDFRDECKGFIVIIEKTKNRSDVFPLLNDMRTLIKTKMVGESAAGAVMLEALRYHVDRLRAKDVHVIKSMANIDDDECAYESHRFIYLF